VTQLSFASRQASAWWRRRLALPVAAAIAAAGLGGCGSISEKFADTASQMPAIGLPAGTPERPATPAAYPAVHDVPPPRNSVMLTNTEAAQMQADLVTARDQQQSDAGLKPPAKKSPVKPPAKVVPASSRGSIY
jgi:hypothetical protein